MLRAIFIAAYIDPSAGGVLLQVLLGGAGGAFLVWKLLWHRIKRVLRLGGAPKSDEIQ